MRHDDNESVVLRVEGVCKPRGQAVDGEWTSLADLVAPIIAFLAEKRAEGARHDDAEGDGGGAADKR